MHRDPIESEHSPNWLDEAVRASPRSIPDGGFSARVAERLSTIKRHRRGLPAAWILWLVVIPGSIPAVFRFPTREVVEEVIAICADPTLLCLTALIVGDGIVGRALLEQD